MVFTGLLRALRGPLALALAAGAVSAGPSFATAQERPECETVDVDYGITASILLRDTPLGAADGVHSLGTGRIKLRFEVSADRATQAVRVLSYETANRLVVEAKVAMWSTTFITRAHTTITTDECVGNARGTLRGDTLAWASDLTGYRSDGTIECEGTMCGKFGSPSRGSSPLHEGPVSFQLKPFRFSQDGASFSMAYVLVGRSDSPRQSTYLAFSGRRLSQACLTRPAASCAGV